MKVKYMYISYKLFQRRIKWNLLSKNVPKYGVKEFTPLEMNRCIVKLDEKSKIKKIERWKKIAETAAKQSKRDIIPKINNFHNIKNIFDLIKEYDILICTYENESENSLKKELLKLDRKKELKIAIIIGPEGGIEPEEIELLRTKKAKIVTIRKKNFKNRNSSCCCFRNYNV